MAFFDKLNDFAKNVGDKTKDAMETSKLNTKIRTEKAAIETTYKKIGELFYQKYASGEFHYEEAGELFTAIDNSNAAIVELEAEIEKIRIEKEAKDAEREAEKAARATQNVPPARAAQNIPPVQAAPSGIICPGCGAQNAAGAVFCGGCGSRIEIIKETVQEEPQDIIQEEVQEPVIKTCSSCGIELADDTKFCSNCGTKV